MGNDNGFIVPEMLCCHGNSVQIMRAREILLLLLLLLGGGRGEERGEAIVMLMNDEWSFLTFFFFFLYGIWLFLSYPSLSFEKTKEKKNRNVKVTMEHKQKLLHKAVLASLLTIQVQFPTGLSHCSCCILQRSVWKLSSFNKLKHSGDPAMSQSFLNLVKSSLSCYTKLLLTDLFCLNTGCISADEFPKRNLKKNIDI